LTGALGFLKAKFEGEVKSMARQLPAGKCFVHAVKSVRNNIAYAFRISWPWYAILIPLGIGASLFAEYMSGGNPEAVPSAPVVVIYIILFAVSLVAFASIAVNWHRYILLDEVPHGSELFRLDDKTWRYLGNVVLIFLMSFAAALLIALPVFGLTFALGENAGPVAFLLIILFIVGMLFIAALFFRMSVKLPAIALGRHDISFKDALAATEGNTLRLLLLVLLEFLAIIGIVLGMLLVLFILGAINAMLAFVVGAVLQFLFNWVFTIFGITLLTSLYGFFVEGRDF
jgi:hypothetical protein